MTRLIIISAFFIVLLTTAAAQTNTPTPQPSTATPLILGPVNMVTPTPRPPEPDDPRLALCSAPYQSGWEARIVEAGDTLASLGAGQTQLSITQLAALNCIDDPSSLPIGSVVWLPPETQLTTSTACPVLGGYSGVSPCPGAVQTVTAAQQLFQGGMMIWRQDTGKIWVIDMAGTVQVFKDTYREGDDDPADTAPSGLFVPTRGFGKVWAQLPGEHEPLGWATSFESQITLMVQPAGRVSYTSYVQLPDGDVYAVTVLPGSTRGWWVKMER